MKRDRSDKGLFPFRPATVARSGGRLRHRSGWTGSGAGPVGRGDSPGRRTVGPQMTQMDADQGRGGVIASGKLEKGGRDSNSETFH